MKQLVRVAAAEWRYWLRSRLALGGAALLVGLLIATSALTTLRMEAERAERTRHQTTAEATFLAQPDRHPHRMVHYGHYAFRTPAPLAVFDPGLDAVTGQSIFLEGHRQNSAMFAKSGESADLGGLSGLSPAMVYQLFGPLLVILLGHGVFARERESGTLATLMAQGTQGRSLLAGKALALLSVVVMLLVPLALSAGLAVHRGESLPAALALIGVYLLYLSVWGLLALLVSATLRRRSAVLATLAALWICLSLVLPSVAVSTVSQAAPLAGKLENDLAMRANARGLSDGHDASDPAFTRLRAELLAQHGVQRVEDLPVNLRGIVAQHAEQQLTETLNAYAQAQMAAEAQQASALAHHGWLSPMLAAAHASRAIAGSDLAHHHRFLNEAEALRYSFVQGLNRVHVEKLAYADDIRRSTDLQAERRTRVDASNWQVLEAFRFEPDRTHARLDHAMPQIRMLAVWFILLGAGVVWATGRLKP